MCATDAVKQKFIPRDQQQQRCELAGCDSLRSFSGLKHSHDQSTERRESRQVCYLPPFPCPHICHPGKKTPSGSWHGERNSCLTQHEAAPEDGCPAFGSNIALVTDRANSPCPLPPYNLITRTLPHTGLLPARDVFIRECPDLESALGLLPRLCFQPPVLPRHSLAWGSSSELPKLAFCRVGSRVGECRRRATFTRAPIPHLALQLGTG